AGHPRLFDRGTTPYRLRCLQRGLKPTQVAPKCFGYLTHAGIHRNYYDKGVKLFWLDEAEPEFSVYDYDNYRYHAGPVLEVGNIY
ncbi:hypothetical protein MJN54_31550, partial [Salmonella enterica subsp. enterica serovar Kentucky]|nr:hypothetical protein [Salmonella enterica subsp. enterica serovar Kentucky]